ncbi:MAG: DUF2279 domain-containing protein [Acidobacteria bacterium]|nr:MAG: DUF2279 domain-containing protein [Acidobacteriota bacterium]
MTLSRSSILPSALLALALLLPSGPVSGAGAGFHLPPDLLAPREPGSASFRLGEQDLGSPAVDGAADAFEAGVDAASPRLGSSGSAETSGEGGAPTVAPKKDRRWLVMGGFGVAFLGLEYAAFWSSANVNEEFQFREEGWFGRYTYAGGADKASHIVGGYITGRIVDAALQRTGTPARDARILSAAFVTVIGTLVEVGDAYHGYGFSWEDAVVTAGGGIVGSVISGLGWDDTVTMRFGMVGKDLPDDPSVILADPNHYSGEVYTLDLRFAGLFPRLKADPKLARFLLFSVTYGSKGYQWVEESARQRLLGFELGLDFHQVALALGVPPDKWWGAIVLGFFKYFRLPFTGIGFQYELNSNRWKGPNSFYRFDF